MRKIGDPSLFSTRLGQAPTAVAARQTRPSAKRPRGTTDSFETLAASQDVVVSKDYIGVASGRRLAATHALMRVRNGAALEKLMALPEGSVQELRSLSINLGQLDYAHIVKVDGARERQGLFSSVLAEALTGDTAPEVVQVQEVWLKSAREELGAVAERCGYELMLDDVTSKTYGLQILAKVSSLAYVHDSGVVEFKNDEPGSRADGRPMRAGFDTVARIRRGYGYALFELKTGLTVLAATTHLSPLNQYAALRDKQFATMARIHGELASRADVVMFGADLNTSDKVSAQAPNLAVNQVADVESLDRFYRATRSIDAFAVAGAPEHYATMSGQLKQFKRSDWDMTGLRIDYQMLGHSPAVIAACTGFATVFAESHVTSRNRSMPLSDHKGVYASYLVGKA